MKPVLINAFAGLSSKLGMVIGGGGGCKTVSNSTPGNIFAIGSSYGAQESLWVCPVMLSTAPDSGIFWLAKNNGFTYIQTMNETHGTWAELSFRLRRRSMNNWGWAAV